MWLKLKEKRKGEPAAKWIESVTMVISAPLEEPMVGPLLWTDHRGENLPYLCDC